MWPYIATLIPSIGLLYLLYVILKHMMEADRRERIAHAQWERAEAADRASGPESPDETK
ncbi:hypothetical protein [Flexivirga sp.]|uniref:hypothetical protein n=1 Tax=Flexivirga sp. TaxID=1962927 RepID=UPI003F800C0B